MLSQNRLYRILITATKNSIVLDLEYNKDTYIHILKTHILHAILHEPTKYDLKDPEDILMVLDAINRFVIAIRNIRVNAINSDIEVVITSLNSYFNRKSISHRNFMLKSLKESLFENNPSRKDKILLTMYEEVASSEEYDELCRIFVERLVAERYNDKEMMFVESK